MLIKKIKLKNIVLDSNIFMAPMVSYTTYPFRLLCYELGAGLCTTEMVNCNSLKYKSQATAQLLFTTDTEKIKCAQLIGENPHIMEKAATSENLEQFDIIDINMGCPVPNVFKSGMGSALLLDLKRASKIIKAVKKSGKIVTVKCRIGVNEKTTHGAEIAKVCEDAGADLITIHGRTRKMMYNGAPIYEEIQSAKACVKIPVIANGGINSSADAEKMMKETSADGVMIGRYALENPFIFSELTNKKITKTKYEIILEQINIAEKCYDETFVISYIVKLASHCMKKRKGTKQYKHELYKCGNIEGLREVIKKIFYENDADSYF